MQTSPVVKRVAEYPQTKRSSASFEKYNPDYLENGIHFDFENDFHYIKQQGKSAIVGPLSTFCTITTGNESRILNQNGLLVPTTTNTPRIETFSGTNGLLVEAASTNLCLHNGDLSQASWTKSETTVSTTTSIDGTTRSIRVLESVNNAIHSVNRSATITANTTYCISAIVKANGRQFAYMYGINTDQFGAVFDFANLTSAQILSGTSSINRRGIIALGNGYYLIYVSGILNAASTTMTLTFGPATSLSVPAGYTYAGDVTKGVDLEYMQLELGAFPTSRILTTTGSVARTADTITRTLGAEYSSTTGTCIYKYAFQSNTIDYTTFSFDDGTNNNRITGYHSGTAHYLLINSGGVTQALINVAGAVPTYTNQRAATTWATNDSMIVRQGALATPDATVTVPSGITTLSLGNGPSLSRLNGWLKSFSYYPKRIPNAVLQGLTT